MGTRSAPLRGLQVTRGGAERGAAWARADPHPAAADGVPEPRSRRPSAPCPGQALEAQAARGDPPRTQL